MYLLKYSSHPSFMSHVILYSITFAIFVALVMYFVYRWRIEVLKQRKFVLEKLILQNTEEVTRQNQEITKQKEALETQQEKISHMYNELMESIHTAQRIQELHLPPASKIKKHLPDFFALYLPKDVVSGDFYWIYEKYQKIYLAAVDCTGHGVAGAFMSIIGNNLLTQIVTQNPAFNAAEILDQLSLDLIHTLHQDSDSSISNEGMDIAFCIIDLYENQLQFAGANNPLYIVKDKVLTQIKADNKGIGLQKGGHKKSFTNHTFDMEEECTYYIFSDGYVSQFGGEWGGEKFKHMRFREIILEISALPITEQKQGLQQCLTDWKKNTEQTDDILVIGFKKPSTRLDY